MVKARIAKPANRAQINPGPTFRRVGVKYISERLVKKHKSHLFIIILI